MPVFPSAANLLQDRQELFQFLLNCQQNCLGDYPSKIISFSQEIDEIEPLVFLQEFSQPDQVHFYFEKPSTQEAIVGLDAVIKFTDEGINRFKNTQDFIHSCLKKNIRVGDFPASQNHLYFCCNFTFFDQNLRREHENLAGVYEFKKRLDFYSGFNFPSASIFLPQWLLYKKDHRCYLIINVVVNIQANLEHLSYKISQIIKKVSGLKRRYFLPFKSISHESLPLKTEIVNSEENFKNYVRSSLQLIKTEKIEKIVLSQAIDVFSDKPFKLIDSLNNLGFLYPDCYIFSTSNGKNQYFIGASPERLLKIDNQTLVTDAIAGSAPRGKTAQEDQQLAQALLSSEKDRWEHQVVVDFIVKQLLNFGLKPHFSRQPSLMQLSNIQHLWTPIHCQILNSIHLLEILAKLHPTPAVAGTPREIALAQIRRYETIDRSLYAAPIGWVDSQGNGEFVVGIRSALLDGERARLYAGAGIVAGSEPEKELAEIQLKLQTLLKALI